MCVHVCSISDKKKKIGRFHLLRTRKKKLHQAEGNNMSIGKTNENPPKSTSLLKKPDNQDTQTKDALILVVTHGWQLYTPCHSVVAVVKGDFVKLAVTGDGRSSCIEMLFKIVKTVVYTV